MNTQIIRQLRAENCSLVLQDRAGNVRTFYKKGVRDLEDLLDHEPDTLKGAVVADKVIGKAAAGLLVVGGVTEVYAEVISRLALPLLQKAGIGYTYSLLVDRIVIPQGDDRCPLEKIVEPAKSAEEVVRLLRRHFEEMKKK